VTEYSDRLSCFGSWCAVHASDRHAVAFGTRMLRLWHSQFSRFEADSELSALNASPGWVVPVSSMMGRFVRAGVLAARLSGGLVDFTLGEEIVEAGYDSDLAAPSLPLRDALALVPERAVGAPRADARWRDVRVVEDGRSVVRPPGLALDSGGIAKGLFADVLAASLRELEAVVIDCAGDLRLSGRGEVEREVEVASPFEQEVIHTFVLSEGGVATSGIGRRSWLDARGRPAHHLLDPSSGRPAFTGVVQVTALAPTAVEAETRAKAALLSGPARAARWLPHGGVIVLDDETVRVVEPPRTLSGFSQVEVRQYGHERER